MPPVDLKVRLEQVVDCLLSLHLLAKEMEETWPSRAKMLSDTENTWRNLFPPSDKPFDDLVNNYYGILERFEQRCIQLANVRGVDMMDIAEQQLNAADAVIKTYLKLVRKRFAPT